MITILRYKHPVTKLEQEIEIEGNLYDEGQNVKIIDNDGTEILTRVLEISHVIDLITMHKTKIVKLVPQT